VNEDSGGLYVRELPPDERPRERLKKLGAEALTTSELIAILFRTGSRKSGAQDVAQRLMAQFGDLEHLARASIEELCSVDGVGTVKALEIKAALELGKRLAAFTGDERPSIRSPEEASALFMSQFKGLDKEHFMSQFKGLDKEHFRAVLLNTKNHILKTVEISVGSLDASLVHPRECFRPAVAASAASIILLHNHPSGDPEPSADDINITKRLKETGKVLGIEVLDHIIFGAGTYVSLKEKGVL
jgi:DNA repair protein RadC